MSRNFATFKASFRSLTPQSPQFTPKCPDPTYDTGCTFCDPQLPPNKQIDYQRRLRGSKSSPWRHLLVHDKTSPDHWPSKLELASTTLVSHITRLKRNLVDPYHPILVSNIHIPTHEFTAASIKTVLYPQNQLIQFPESSLNDDKFVETFIEQFLVPDSKVTTNDKVSVSAHDKDMILICGHTQRDVRCGVLAPLIYDEFIKVLSRNNIENVDVGFVSHIGGHLFAGNVLYFKQNGESIWYGRVKPSHVQGIVSETIIGGRIIEELYRG